MESSTLNTKSPDVPDPNPPQSMPTADFYQLIQQQLNNEDSSMNERINWLIVSQSFLFSVLATLLGSTPDPEVGHLAKLHDILLWLIPGISLLASGIIYVGILTSLVYMGDLRQSYLTYPQDGTVEHFPPIQATTVARRLAHLPAIGVPLLFIVTWAILLIQELF